MISATFIAYTLFDLFDQRAFTIGVTQHGTCGGDAGYLFGAGGRTRRPALAMDMGGFGRPQYDFLAFPGEEPSSIECNGDAGEEFIAARQAPDYGGLDT